MQLRVLTAVPGAPWESTLVTGLERGASGLSVVRRCVDVADLLATAATGHARAVLLSADLRRLDREALARLATSRVAVVGVVGPGDEDAERRLRQLGIAHVVPADAAPAELAAAVRAAVADEPAVGTVRAFADPAGDGLAMLGPAGAWSSGIAVDGSGGPLDGPGGPAVEPGSGRVVAVWGPTGAPGRTTLAVTLAAECAALGRPTLLADADTYGGVVAQVLGLLDEAPGLAATARSANAGQLDLPALARHARQVGPQLRVLTGVARADRWPELRPAALEVVWGLARSLVAVTVVDCGFSLEQDEELSFDTAAPRRNGATLATLDTADVVLAVGSADPVGLQRLVRGLADLREAVPDAVVQVVVNKVRPGRSGPIGGDVATQVRQSLDRYAGVDDVVLLPDDRSACDRALAAGRTLTEVAPDSPLRRAVAELAARLVGEPAGAVGRGRGLGRLRPRR